MQLINGGELNPHRLTGLETLERNGRHNYEFLVERQEAFHGIETLLIRLQHS